MPKTKEQSNLHSEPEQNISAAQPKQSPSGLDLAVDVGNRVLKYCTNANVMKTLPSWHKDLEARELSEAKADDKSAVMTYVQGNNIELIGQSWAVGVVAQDLGGTPTFESEKAFLAPKLFLAMIDSGLGGNELQINRLVCALPNDLQTEKVEALRKGLSGTHKVVRNGNALTVEIRAIEVQPETLGAFNWSLANKLFSYARVNGILDLGGKTGIGQLYTKNGTLIRESRVIVEGTYKLAQMVAAHPQLMGQDFTPNLSLIMDAIDDGSLMYGTTGISFAEDFPRYVNEWLSGIRNKLKIVWSKWLPELGEVVMVGGSAHLATGLVEQTEGRFKIAEQPQLCGVMGMLL